LKKAVKNAYISDVHANLEALEAVFADIDKQSVHNIYFLGDAVGYGANPNECTSLIKQNSDLAIAGNHDHAALGITDISVFNERAAEAIMWTFEVMNEETSKYLEKQPFTREIEDQNVFLAHGSPYEPKDWLYVLNMDDVERSLEAQESRICLVGHSHRPFVAEKTSEGELMIHPMWVQLTEGSRYVINVGSVGQPRDRDPRACYLIIDDDMAELRRVEYDIPTTQRKILDAGLPEQLARRIALGR
jgi:predicted phosphodiesterase